MIAGNRDRSLPNERRWTISGAAWQVSKKSEIRSRHSTVAQVRAGSPVIPSLTDARRTIVNRAIRLLRPHEQACFERALAGKLGGIARPTNADVRTACSWCSITLALRLVRPRSMMDDRADSVAGGTAIRNEPGRWWGSFTAWDEPGEIPALAGLVL